MPEMIRVEVSLKKEEHDSVGKALHSEIQRFLEYKHWGFWAKKFGDVGEKEWKKKSFKKDLSPLSPLSPIPPSYHKGTRSAKVYYIACPFLAFEKDNLTTGDAVRQNGQPSKESNPKKNNLNDPNPARVYSDSLQKLLGILRDERVEEAYVSKKNDGLGWAEQNFDQRGILVEIRYKDGVTDDVGNSVGELVVALSTQAPNEHITPEHITPEHITPSI